jgi:hypothetical protein
MTKASTVDEADETNGSPDKSKQQPHRVSLPGFIAGDEAGLGDVIKRTTSYLGIQPCGSCEQRAAKLNRWLAFTPRRSK